MWNVVAFFQLDFSDDIVKIIQAAINSDGGQPEVKKANSMVKSFFIRVSCTTVVLKSAWCHHCLLLLESKGSIPRTIAWVFPGIK